MARRNAHIRSDDVAANHGSEICAPGLNQEYGCGHGMGSGKCIRGIEDGQLNVHNKPLIAEVG